MRSAFKSFTDPAEFAEALSPSKVELLPRGRGRFAAVFAEVDLPRIRLRRLGEAMPRLAHVQHPPERAYFGFLADEASAPVAVDGMSVTADAILHFGSVSNSSQQSFGATQWANISFDRAELEGLCRNIAEQDISPSGPACLVLPGKDVMSRLRGLHEQAVALVTESPATLAKPEVARGMEGELMEAIADCLAASAQRQPTSVQARHAVVTERFRELLDASLDRPLYLPEVCAELGVSRRTLSYCCHDLLGMAPKRYFYLRRMHMVRRALQKADLNTATVTEIATRHGFWEFGRFSVQYKAMFGERPSATLRKEGRNAGD